jgi:hypothetical protein
VAAKRPRLSAIGYQLSVMAVRVPEAPRIEADSC